jgi:hypothetical protein
VADGGLGNESGSEERGGGGEYQVTISVTKTAAAPRLHHDGLLNIIFVAALAPVARLGERRGKTAWDGEASARAWAVIQ